ncbi:MAG: transcriptional regulator [Candidatus Methanomethylicota archaeon]|uniref:Putative HTH-type transcriptional regulatory protein DRJ31_06485 n=1 Tax=Thermoproteota archaeon TaxID=2056631 RepID=A0A497F0P4_9CREN|nr:MAG: transcriptional regulator [Candidatus Verstraetearchaeota archaeon]RLE52879.1 MAG: transcriptional regulator [Candidatus Verstraetearchaeota archaeon]
MKQEVLPSIALRILSGAGYKTSPLPKTKEYCLDLAAKKGDNLLLLKTISNIDNFSRESAEELSALAKVFNASPILIGLRSSKGALERGAAYERQDIPTVDPSTFEDAIVRGNLPYVYFKRGGIYVKIDGKALREARKLHNMSIGELAAKVGVSRKTIYAYEREDMEATLATAIKLEEVLGIPVTSAVDIFKKSKEGAVNALKPPSGPVASQVYEKLRKIGLHVLGFRRAPFEIHIEDFKVSIVTSNGKESEQDLRHKVEMAKGIAQIVGNEPVVITGGDVALSEDVKVLKAEEVRKVDSARKLARMLEVEN